MQDSIFTKKTAKNFSSIAAARTKIANKERSVVAQFMKETDADTMHELFELIKKFGHPSEKNKVELIETKYDSGKDLDFDDIAALELLYKSNCQHNHN